MRITELQKDLGAFIGDLVIWLSCVRAPISATKEILDSDLEERRKIVTALRIWMTAFFIILLVQLPIYHSFGISWDQVSFHLPNAILQILFLFGYSALIHLSLRLFGVRSNYTETLIIYTVLVGAYSPIITLLNYPQTIKMLAILQSTKTEGLGILEAIQFIVAAFEPKPLDSFVDVTIIILSPFMQLIAYLMLVLMTYEIIDRYKCAKLKGFTAVGFSIGVLGLPAVLGYSMLYLYVMYIFVGGEHVQAPQPQ